MTENSYHCSSDRDIATCDEQPISQCQTCIIKNKQMAATLFCETCDVVECQDCSKMHADLKRFGQCKEHKKSLKYFCKDENKMCCTTCAIEDHRKCTNVKSIAALPVEYINQECSIVKEKLVELKEQNASRISLAKSAIIDIEQQVQVFVKTLDSLRNKIIQRFDDFTRDILNKSNIIRDQKVQQLDVLRKNSEGVYQSLSSEIDFFNHADEHGRPVEKFMIKHRLQESLDEYMNATCVPASSIKTTNLTLEFDDSVVILAHSEKVLGLLKVSETEYGIDIQVMKKTLCELTENSYHCSSDTDIATCDEQPISQCQPCTVKNKQMAATLFCETCNEYQCQDCSKIHLLYAFMKSHVLVPVANARSRLSNADLKGFDQCKEHKKSLKYFCKDENKMCCTSCAIDDHRKCTNVKSIVALPVEYINQEFLIVKEKLVEFKEQNASRISLAKSAIIDIEQQVQGFVKTLDSLRNKIIQRFDDFARDILNKSNTIRDQKVQQLDVLRKHSEGVYQSLSSEIDFFSHVDKNGTPDEKFMIKHRLQESLNEYMNATCVPASSIKTTNLTLEFDDSVAILAHSEKVLGLLKVSETEYGIDIQVMKKAAALYSLIHGFKRLLAIAVQTDISFKEAEKTKEYLKDLSKFAVAPAAALASAVPGATTSTESEE